MVSEIETEMTASPNRIIFPPKIWMFVWITVLLGWIRVTLQESPPCSSWHNATCTSCVNEPLTLTCAENFTVIGFIHAGYRAIDQSDCSPQPDDCLAEPVPLIPEISRCMWKQPSCTFTLRPFHFPRGQSCDFTHGPQYLVTSHTRCVEDSKIHAVCQAPGRHVTVESDITGYVTSPNFPQPYRQKLELDMQDCWVTLHTSPEYGICLTGLYMDLPHRHRQTEICTGDYVEITWNTSDSEELSSSVYCADDVINMCVFQSDVTLMFVITLEDHTRHGFAIQYNNIKEEEMIKDKDPCLDVERSDWLPVTVTMVPSVSEQHTLVAKVVISLFICLVLVLCIVMVIVCVVCVLQRRQRPHTDSSSLVQGGVRFLTLKDTATDGWGEGVGGHM